MGAQRHGVLAPVEALALQVSTDGSIGALRTLLARLDDAAIPVDGLSAHTPDLDDVFFALTGGPGIQKGGAR